VDEAGSSCVLSTQSEGVGAVRINALWESDGLWESKKTREDVFLCSGHCGLNLAES
jgi:hypothetical protein